ncbi:MAG: hypothetical protein IJX54_02030 [Oscillospiraceae bacterium]|nr:hypothetical protein [Oscillospiraceae bacterium]
MNNKANLFSDTEDTKLKRFLKGNNIYIMLGTAIVSFLIFILTLIPILNINSNIKTAENLVALKDINVHADLHDQYVQGDVYKFVGRLGYIAASEAAATEYYYLMYLDNADGNQYAVLVEVPIAGDADLQNIVTAYLNYAKDPDAGYQGNIIQLGGRFRKMSNDEETLFSEGLSKCAVTVPYLTYTLEVGQLPEASQTVAYYFFCVPFGIIMIVAAVLFLYGQKLEAMREKANESPYPYLNRKNKKK